MREQRVRVVAATVRILSYGKFWLQRRKDLIMDSQNKKFSEKLCAYAIFAKRMI